jgi:hypothetical protein
VHLFASGGFGREVNIQEIRAAGRTSATAAAGDLLGR